MRILQGPPLDRVRVSFMGRHFQAGWEYCQQLLRPNDRIDLVHDDASADVILPFLERIDAKRIREMKNTRLIQQFGVGLEGIDVKAAAAHGIAVCNIPAHHTGNAQSTAEHATWLSLALLRQTHSELPRRFARRELGGLPIPRTLYGKRVTLVGYGAVGSTLGTYLTTMGAHVTAVQPQWIHPPLQESIVPVTRVEEVLPATDLLILACVLNQGTLHFMNAERFSLLPPHALVVNIGRGPLVDYDALVHALENDAIAGFASDVGVGHKNKPSEPWDPDDPLSQDARVIFTPHVGGYTDTSYQAMAPIVLENIRKIQRQERPDFWVNEPKIL